MIMLDRRDRRWPTSIDEAVDRILVMLTEADKEQLRKASAGDLDSLHFGLGANVRNEFGLWSGNTALLAACGSPDIDPDASSAVIVKAVWERLRAMRGCEP